MKIAVLVTDREKYERKGFKLNMERNENGLSAKEPTMDDYKRMIGNGEREMGNGCRCEGCGNRQLAMVYSPMQCWRRLYTPADALMHGTLFEELYKPCEEV